MESFEAKSDEVSKKKVSTVTTLLFPEKNKNKTTMYVLSVFIYIFSSKRRTLEGTSFPMYY